MSYHSFHTKKYSPSVAGFGLIELMVSISIMALIMGMVFTRQGSFNSSVLLRSQAYEIALHLREVQLNAVSATNIGGSGSNDDYQRLLGLTFNEALRNSYQVKLFGCDVLVDSICQTIDSGTQFGQQGTLDRRFELGDVRDDGNATYSEVSVVFQRPNFDAKFYDINGDEIDTTFIEIDVVRAGYDTSSPANYRIIEVTSAGQISVRKTDS